MRHSPPATLPLLLLATMTMTAYAAKTADSNGCHSYDHEACDEICKQDNYWYGHCAQWNGRDFQCKCVEYKQPLQGQVCGSKQRQCTDECFKSGHEFGGYCYPHPTSDTPNGDPRCRCFEELPFLADDSGRKRRKRR
uniref:Knottin scorpion toxin-like domain-containing protein n=1 Tax=Plectus sambesii TaxID=2011161 RepID=A0A914VZ07_9BILA